MRLSKLYSNQPEVFVPIEFTPGLNVVLAEIRLPENRAKDTHNLGKTTLGRVVNFCLLSKRDKGFFLFKHYDIFKDFVFFLEIQLLDGSFLTIRRGVKEASKVSFMRHDGPFRDLSNASDDTWDHSAISFEKAKELLDGALDFRDLGPWPFRKVVGYLLRSQEDFREVFHLRKFAGSHADWKPFLAHLLGFNSDTIVRHYAKESELAKRIDEEDVIERELGGSVEDISKIEGILLLKQNDALKKQRLLDDFDFRQADSDRVRLVVDELDVRIAQLNAERYALAQARRKITASMADDELLFDVRKASELFAEAGVVFTGQIRRDFEQLIAFNRAITDERRGYLAEELKEVESRLNGINSELLELGRRRAETLSFLSGTDIFQKYKRVADELVILRAEIRSLEGQKAFLHRLQELRSSIRRLNEEKGRLQGDVEMDVERQNTEVTSLFSQIRVYFNDIIEEVLDRKALLSVSPNQEGHLEFRAEILDESGNATSADLGTTYRKLLCIAFDLALLHARLASRYPRFVFHDGVFEALDDRKKENLIAVIRSHAYLGIQQIITLIDSDLPVKPEGAVDLFDDAEIILRLHDEDESGRLFRMDVW